MRKLSEMVAKKKFGNVKFLHILHVNKMQKWNKIGKKNAKFLSKNVLFLQETLVSTKIISHRENI